MMAKFYNSELRDFLNDNSKYRDNLVEIYSKMSSIEYCNELTEALAYILESNNAEPIEVLLGSRLVKDCLLYNPSVFLPFYLLRLLPMLEKIGSFKAGNPDLKRGQDYFGSNANFETKKLGMSLIRFVLEFLEVSTRLFPNEKEIIETFYRLKSKDVKFPESLHYFKNIDLSALSYQKKELDIKPKASLTELCSETLQILESNKNESFASEKLILQLNELRHNTMSNGHQETEETMNQAEKQISYLQSWKDMKISFDELRLELLEFSKSATNLTENDGYNAISNANNGDFSDMKNFQQILSNRIKSQAMKDIEIILLTLHSYAYHSSNLEFFDLSNLRANFNLIFKEIKDKIILRLSKEFIKFWRIMSYETGESSEFQQMFTDISEKTNFEDVVLDMNSFKSIYSDFEIHNNFDNLAFKKKCVQNFKYFLNLFFTEADEDFKNVGMLEELLNQVNCLICYKEVFKADTKIHIALSNSYEILSRGKNNPTTAFISLKKNSKFLELKGLSHIFLGVEVGALYDPGFHVFYLNEFFKKNETDFKLPETGSKLNDFLKNLIEEPAYKYSISEGNRISGELKFVMKNYNFPNVDYGEIMNVNNSSFLSISSKSSRIMQSSRVQGLNMSLRSMNNVNYDQDTDLLKKNYEISMEIRNYESELKMLKISNLKLTQEIKNLHKKFNEH